MKELTIIDKSIQKDWLYLNNKIYNILVALIIILIQAIKKYSLFKYIQIKMPLQE